MRATTGAAGVLAILLSQGTAAAEGGDGRHGSGEYEEARSYDLAADRGYPIALTRPAAQRQATFVVRCRYDRTAVAAPVCTDMHDEGARVVSWPDRHRAPVAGGAVTSARGRHAAPRHAGTGPARIDTAAVAPDRSAPRAEAAGQQPAAPGGGIGVGPGEGAPGAGLRADDQADPGSHHGGIGVGTGDRAPAGAAGTADSRTGAPAQRDTDGDGYSDGSMHESPEVGRRDGMHPSGTAAGTDDKDNDATHDASDLVNGKDDDGDGIGNDVDARPGPDFDANHDGVIDGREKPQGDGYRLAEPDDGRFYGGTARFGPVEVTGGMHPSGQIHAGFGLAAGTKAPVEFGGYTPDPNGINAEVSGSVATQNAAVGGGASVNLSPDGRLSGTGYVEGGVTIRDWELTGGISVTCDSAGCDWDAYTSALREVQFDKPGMPGKTGKPKVEFGARINVSGTFSPPELARPSAPVTDPVTTPKQGRVGNRSPLERIGVVETPGVRDALREAQNTQEPSPERFGRDVGGIGVIDTPGVREAAREASGLDGDDATGASSARGSMSDENADRDGSSDRSDTSASGSRGDGLDGNDSTGASSGRGSMSDENADRDSSPHSSDSDLDGNDATGASSARGSMSDENADR